MNYKDYYSQTYILFELVKCLNHRETVFMILRKDKKPFVIRGIKAFTIDFFKRNAKAYRFYDRPCKLFHSLAVLDAFDTFSYSPAQRKEQRKAFNEHFPELMHGYDPSFDFDGVKGKKVTSRSRVYRESKKFKALLEENLVPYHLKFSGSKGFHFVIPYEFLPGTDPMASVELCGKITDNIKAVFNLKTLDEKIADFRRIWKAPYSIDFVEIDGETIETVALPLNDKQFDNFFFESLRVKNVVRDIKLKYRGLLLRDYGLSKKQLSLNTKKFINEWENVV